MCAETTDYKSTLNLPRTDFPMRAGLPKREPDWLARWAQMNVYDRLRAKAAGREPFTLHDGPPYANGHLHIGHALNKILKDMVVRSQQMMGRDARYIPGWDCHGLPIEWKIEEKYRAKGQDKDAVDVVEFRQECRDFAAGWVDIQREEFKRLGVTGNWADPYLTMNFKTEANIVRALGKIIDRGHLVRGFKPVYWSVVGGSALAEAEVEYMDKTSFAVDVAFDVSDEAAFSTAVGGIEGEGCLSVVIWTTTPWTLPANQAVSLHPELDYVVLACELPSGEKRRLIVAEALSASPSKAFAPLYVQFVGVNVVPSGPVSEFL